MMNISENHLPWPDTFCWTQRWSPKEICLHINPHTKHNHIMMTLTEPKINDLQGIAVKVKQHQMKMVLY